jgi:acetylornithine deacetylase
MKDVTALLLDLVAIPSVSSMSNQPVIDYVTRTLDPRLWSFDFHTSEDAVGKNKTNLVAFPKNAREKDVELAFVCHTDTVPFMDDWAEAVHPALRDGKIYGRGSCDVKGFLACALAALHEVDFTGNSKPVALVLTADEEVGCVGAKKLASLKAFSARHMVIGEPTGLRPVVAGKGYSLGTITVFGREAHSAFPAEGHSAVYDAARLLICLESLAKELESNPRRCFDPPGFDPPFFDPPFTTLNVGLIEGGTAKNIVPGECRLTVEWRPIPGVDPDEVPNSIHRLIAMLTDSVPGFNADFEVKRADAAFAPSQTQRLSARLSELTGNAPGTISFGSEAAHLSPLAEEITVFGPGDMTVAHRTGEFVAVADLLECQRVLKQLTEEFQTTRCG